MPLKSCTQYATKFGKLSSGHRTGKGQFSFQSQRKAMLKNVQIIAQWHSFHMPAGLCSKSFKLGFSNRWTKNFQVSMLDLENKRSYCQYTLDHRESKEIPPQKIYICFIDCESLDSVDHNKLWKIPKEMGIPDHLTCLLCGSAGKESACYTGYLGSIPGLGISPGEGKG